MKNRSKLVILVTLIIFQILLPVAMITYDDISDRYTTEKGEIYRFPLEQIVCTENDVRFSVRNTSVWSVKYAVVENDADGMAVMTRSKSKPAGVNYIESKGKSFYFDFPVDKIETDAFSGKQMLTLYDEEWYVESGLKGFNEACFDEAYLEAYVYKGDVVPVAIYVEGVPLEEFVKRTNLS